MGPSGFVFSSISLMEEKCLIHFTKGDSGGKKTISQTITSLKGDGLVLEEGINNRIRKKRQDLRPIAEVG